MVLRIKKGTGEYEQLVSYGVQNNTVFDKLCALLIVLSPLLQHYRGLYENAGFTVLLLIFPVLTIRFVLRSSAKRFSAMNMRAFLPLFLFELYTAVVHSPSAERLLYIAFMTLVFLYIASGCINTAYLLKYATNIVCIVAFLLFVQYIFHYIFHHTLDLRPLNLLVDQESIWIRHLDTSSASKLYRPAAFFLEPSHLFLFSFPLLCIFLLSPGMTKWRQKKAMIITVAMIMSTSGFSIVICLGLWSLYFLFYKGKRMNAKKVRKKILSTKNIIIFLLLIIIVVVAFNSIPVLKRSVSRILTNTEGTSAISGRVTLALNYIRSITGRAVLFGTPNVSGTLDFNLAGFFATFIKWGILGLFFTYWFYGQGLFLLKRKYYWLTAIIIVISFFTAHTHGTFYMMYFTIFLMNGYYEKNLGGAQASFEEAKETKHVVEN